MTDTPDKIRRPRKGAVAQGGAVAQTGDAAPKSAPTPSHEAGEARVAKVMARAGLCSRRDAEAWILAGRVAVNGTTIESPALNIGPDDAITVDGYPIDKAERTRLFMFNKTRGLVTTAKDPEGRPTIYAAIPEDLPRLITIGRLDINTEGLLLLTNDGGLARLLELPSTGWLRRYRVRAKGTIDQPTLDRLAEGVTIDDVDYAGIDAKLDRVQGANLWLTMGLREGKNREIKRVLEHLGLIVNRLIRISYGPFQLGDLAENAVEEVRTQVLRDQLGPALAREAGVDFEGPATAAVVTREVRRAKADERRSEKQAREAAPAARTPLKRAAEAPRQHVSALRAGRADVTEGPRRKTERSATEDRKGRSVSVERISTAVRKRPEGLPTRNARRFEKERAEGGETERPARRERTAPAGRDGTRPERTRPPRSAEEARPTRGDAESSRSGARPRTVRQADGDRARREDAPRIRAPSRDERPRPDRPRTDRPRTDRPTGERPRTERPRAERPNADRPRTDRLDSGRSERPRTDRPRTDRPRTERPRTERPDRQGAERPARGERPPRGDAPRSPRAAAPRAGKPAFGGKPRTGGDRPSGRTRPDRDGDRPPPRGGAGAGNRPRPGSKPRGPKRG